MRNGPKLPLVNCPACGGEGLSSAYVPELMGHGDDQPCEQCDGVGLTALPHKFEVCPQCEGRGSSSAYLGAFTASEWAEQDHEFKEEYLAGQYDRTCETCNGLRVVAVPDESRCEKSMLDEYNKRLAEVGDEREVAND